MDYTYAPQANQEPEKKKVTKPPLTEKTASGVSMDSLRDMYLRPSAEDKGHRAAFPDEVREQMEHAFHMKMEAVKLYESQRVADAGADAVARGNEIAFAPGKLDFSSRRGRSLLGHELSHVSSQARGEVTGSGFLDSPALEQRADREGAIAASGGQVYSGGMYGNGWNGGGMYAPLGPISSASAAPAAAPMQASRSKKSKEPKKAVKPQDNDWEQMESPFKGDAVTAENPLTGETIYKPFKGGPVSAKNIGTGDVGFTMQEYFKAQSHYIGEEDEQRSERLDALAAEMKGEDYKKGAFKNNINNPNTGSEISGLDLSRVIPELKGSLGESMPIEGIGTMYRNIMAPQKVNPDQGEDVNAKYNQGLKDLKKLYYTQLKRLEATYGTMFSQMHPEDIMRQGGLEFQGHKHILQDTQQLLVSAPELFDFENSKEDKEFKRLNDYYGNIGNMMTHYMLPRMNEETEGEAQDYSNLSFMDKNEEDYLDPALAEGIAGPRMNEKELKQYKKDLKNRAKKGDWKHRLFGKFK